MVEDLNSGALVLFLFGHAGAMRLAGFRPSDRRHSQWPMARCFLAEDGADRIAGRIFDVVIVDDSYFRSGNGSPRQIEELAARCTRDHTVWIKL